MDEVDDNDYAILVLPGGVINPDKLRRDKKAVAFVRSFFSIKKDLHNAGANWVDEAVVEDGNLITSRNPGDLEAFNKRIIDRI